MKGRKKKHPALAGTKIRRGYLAKLAKYLASLPERNGRRPHIAAWTDLERECVRKELASGRYCVEEAVRVELRSPHGKLLSRGSGKLFQNDHGIRLECSCWQEEYTLIRRARSLESLRIGRRFGRRGDCLVLAGAGEFFWCCPAGRDAAAKIMFAAEESLRLSEKSEKKSKQT